VARPRLAEAVRRGLEGRLVAVVAGAGYGKTTLLAQVIAEEQRPWAWCSCDGRILDAPGLVAHVAAGIAGSFPGFDARLDLEGAAEDVVGDLSNELVATVSEDLVVVLDDVHALPTEATAGVRLLTELLPDSVHLAIAGRMPLPLPLARLRAGRTVEIGEGPLALTEEESSALLASVGAELEPDERAALHRRTEGWPAGLILAAQSGDAVGNGAELTGAQFDYLAEEVLGHQEADVQRLMLGTAALGRFSAELAAAVTGMPDAGALARRLVERHLFTVRLDTEGEWYRYHHLFRDFLRRQVVERDPGALAEQHRRAAAWWSDAGDPVAAVGHLVRSGDHEAAAAALEPVAESMLRSEQAEILAEWLDEIPRAVWEERPGLVLAHAALLLTRARHEASFAESERAIAHLLAAGEGDRAAAALVRMQQSMVTAGTSPGSRIAVGQRWVPRIPQGARLLPVAHILLATGHGYGCRFDEARADLAAATAAHAAQGDPMIALLASVADAFYVEFWRESPTAAHERIRTAVHDLAARESEDTLALMSTARMLHAYTLNELGRHAEALDEWADMQASLPARGWGKQAIRRSGSWVACTALAGLGRWEELEARFEPPPQPGAAEHPTSYSYRYRVPGALLSAHRGVVADVRVQIEAARDEMAVFGTAFDDGSFLCDLSLAAARAGLADLAREQAQDALATARRHSLPWLTGRATLAVARAEPGWSGLDEALAEALALTASHAMDPLWTHRAGDLAAPLLLRALERGLGPPGAAEAMLVACGGDVIAQAARFARGLEPAVRARLAELAGETPDTDIALIDGLLRDPAAVVREAARRSWTRVRARPRAAIQIESMGHLRVLRDGVPVPDAGFARPRARALLAALLAAGGAAHREVLCERLWPDLPLERAAAALRTTLHDLRRAVEPELDAGDPSALLTADAEFVRLTFGERDGWDAAELRRLAPSPADETGDERLARLRRADALCTGDFLAEWPFEDWAEPPRRELAALQDEVATDLAAALLDAGDHAGAIKRLERLSTRDPEREGLHLALMRAYAAAGERAMALRQYHLCRTVLRREQGVEPGPQIRALYLALVADDAGAGAGPHEPGTAPPAGTVTIVFTDIEGSTEIAERLGDRRWVQALAEHDSTVRRHAAAHGGYEVKAHGDGLMLAFPSARWAVDFAVALQRELASCDASEEPLSVRIGLHTGEAIRQGDDFFGRAVIVAARIAALCRGGEILVSDLVKRLVDSAGDLAFDEGRDVVLKGLREPQRIHALHWEEAAPRDASVMRGA
jgi:DNA-binding SARP family transcriptional activator